MFIDTKEPSKTIDFTKPSVEALVAILRDKSKWPKGFVWDFTHSETCAMALAFNAWPNQILSDCRGRLCSMHVAPAIGISFADALMVFGTTCPYGYVRLSQVTPEMVADELERRHAFMRSQVGDPIPWIISKKLSDLSSKAKSGDSSTNTHQSSKPSTGTNQEMTRPQLSSTLSLNES